MSGEIKKDLRTEAQNFSASLSKLFLLKRRDPQTKHLLEKAQHLIDGLLAESPRPAPAPPTPRAARGGGGMGQLWVKLDELKRENDDLKRQRGRSLDEKASSPKSPKSPKPQPGLVESPSADLHQVKAECENLKCQIEKLQLTIKEHQTLSANLQDDCRRSKAGLEAAQKLARKTRDENKKLEANLASLRSEHETLIKQKHAQSHPVHSSPPPKPAISSPKPKPRAESRMPPESPRTDNRLTENISERCRPSNIAVAYTTLESQQWMDAKDGLEDYADEAEVVKFLCDVLMRENMSKVVEASHEAYGKSSSKTSCSILQSVERVVSHVLTNPTSAVTLVESGVITSHCPLSEDIGDLIRQTLRASFDKICTRRFAQITKGNCNSTSPLTSEWSNPAFQKYVNECGALAWQMTIQKPPMKLSTSDTRFDEARHKLWWSCNQSKARKIDYFIWPILFDYEGGSLMVKGCVHAS